jgi:hypothetical protein
MMAKKQIDYLADLLSDETVNAPHKPVETKTSPSPAVRRPSCRDKPPWPRERVGAGGVG